jgi:hypothetical protein
VRGEERWLGIRILVAFEDVYRVYREVIAAGIQVLRPQVETRSIGLDHLEGEIARLEPQVVICSRDKPASLPLEIAWIKIPIDSVPHSKLTLESLLMVIDEFQETRSTGKIAAQSGL